ncbi:MAG: SLC13 family permease [Armatimonadota bacterium]
MHRRALFAIIRRRWLIAALVLGTVLLLSSPPAGLSLEGWRALAVTIIAVVLFVTEAVPLPAVALLIAAGQVLLQIKRPNEVAASFMNDSVFFIMGSLMLAVAMVKQRLDRRIAFALTRLSGPKTKWLAFGFLAMAAVIASFIGEHTVAGLMLPVALVMVNASGEDDAGKRRLAQLLLVSVAYGCVIGGQGTPSGGARNAIMLQFWSDPGIVGTRVSYGAWIKFAYPVVLLQIPLAFGVIWFGMRPQRRELSAAVAALREQLAEEGRMGLREWAGVAIFLPTIVAWITLSERLGLGMIALLAATAYLVFGLVEWSDYNSGVNWGVVLVYAAAISLGIAMQETGAAEWVATNALAQLRAIGIGGGIALLAVFAGVTLFFTNTMSAGATVAVLAPILLDMAQDAGLDPVIAGFIVALASAYAYLTVFAHPAIMIVYGSGHLHVSDFLRLGWRATLVSLATVLLMAHLYWPHLNIPRPPG